MEFKILTSKRSPFRAKYKIEFFRSSERSNSAVPSREKEISLHENITDAFVDLYDAVEKIENEKTNNGSSVSFAAQIKPAPGPTLGELVHMNVS